MISMKKNVERDEKGIKGDGILYIIIKQLKKCNEKKQK